MAEHSLDLANQADGSAAGAGRRRWVVAAGRAAWVLVLLGVLVVLAAQAPFQLEVLRRDWQIQRAAPAILPLLGREGYYYYWLVLGYSSFLVHLSTASLIFWRKSAGALGLIASTALLTLPVAFSLTGYPERFDFYPPPWDATLMHLREGLSWFVALPCLGALFFAFPDGRLEPRGLKPVALAVAAAYPVLMVGLNRATPASSDVWYTLTLLTVLGGLAAGLYGQVYRYRYRSGPVQRQQTRLVVLSLAAIVLGLIGTGLFLVAGDGLTGAWAAFFALNSEALLLTLLPVSLAVSMLRYRLWDAGVFLNRAIVYAMLTALVMILYVLVVGLLGVFFQSVGDVALAVLATGLVAALFQPLRQRVQHAVNRMLYGERDDPATVLSRLGRRLEGAFSPEAVFPTLVETVATALKSPYVAVVLHDAGSDCVAAEHGQAGAHARALALPLAYQGERIGRLVVAPRAPGEAYSRADHRLLAEIARQAGPAVHAVRLTGALQRSRERIVSAREDERRRLRRDLHDGLGPTLASQSFKLEAALDLLDRDPEAARALLRDVKTQAQVTIADIRRLVYELRPPTLDELGLAGALREMLARYEGAAHAPRFDFYAPEGGLPSLPAAVEVAAYRIAAEAVTNVVRHAGAGECRVSVETPGHWLLVTVEDDGAGLPPRVSAGVGLASMRERAAELGGVCDIGPRPGGGTRVAARLPLAAA